MIIRYSPAIVKKTPELFDYIESKSIWTSIYYFLISRSSQITNLQSWFADIVKNPTTLFIHYAKEIPTYKDPDDQIETILSWVSKNITYVADSDKWKLEERWQTPDETLQTMTGDCEDGALLIAALALYKGIPSNRLLIMGGSVNGGGHCWVGYKATEYPLNWCFMDWCYWCTLDSCNDRTKYYIKGQTIYDDPSNNYYSIWFAFNDKQSYQGLNNSN